MNMMEEAIFSSPPSDVPLGSSRKRNPISRPKILSPLMKKKHGRRAHQLVIGYLYFHGPSETNQLQQTVKRVSETSCGAGKGVISEHGPGDIGLYSLGDHELIANNKPLDPFFEPKDNISSMENTEESNQWFETHDEVKEDLKSADELLDHSCTS